ncbi:MAG: hypothetical protein EOM69_09350 [Clostridia bacterium]|nr:hypothetical protein [Clostridia bacterium]
METNRPLPCCGTCAAAKEETWSSGKDALRCFAPGEHRGYTVDIYPEGRRAGLARQGTPKWCPGYKEA